MINFAELIDTFKETTPGYTPAQKETMAKQMGFKNAEEMLAFERQKQMRRDPSTIAKQGGPSQGKPQPPKQADPRGFFQVIQDALVGKVGPS